jgi:hypothetical protein
MGGQNHAGTRDGDNNIAAIRDLCQTAIQKGKSEMTTQQEVKEKWRELAKEWWASCGKSSCYCDDNRCLVDGENHGQSKVLEPGQGYLHHLTKRIYCEECADRRLDEEWSWLQSYPV